MLLIQYIGITLGLYSIAYLAGDKLRLGAIFFILFTYLLFLFFIAQQVSLGLNFYQSIYEDLRAIESGGTQLSATAQNLIGLIGPENSGLLGTIPTVAFLLLATLGGILYLVIRYREGHRARLSD